LLANIHRSLEAHLTLLDDGRPCRRAASCTADFVLEALNLDHDPQDIVAVARRFDTWWRQPAEDRPVQNLNLLFHGAPGTGKTELAKHLARDLDRPLLVKRASDLLGSYIGQTEKALAAAFAQAEADEAILLIDEADTLLFPRDMAQRSWEVSFTNEFLTQMESFRGMMVCTTNRIGNLDDASLRRFGRKVEFGFLDATGAVTLYERLLAPLASGRLTTGQRDRIGRLPGLTPGAFRVVRDGAVLASRSPSHSDLISALENEAKMILEFEPAPVGFRPDGQG